MTPIVRVSCLSRMVLIVVSAVFVICVVVWRTLGKTGLLVALRLCSGLMVEELTDVCTMVLTHVVLRICWTRLLAVRRIGARISMRGRLTSLNECVRCTVSRICMGVRGRLGLKLQLVRLLL